MPLLWPLPSGKSHEGKGCHRDKDNLKVNLGAYAIAVLCQCLSVTLGLELVGGKTHEIYDRVSGTSRLPVYLHLVF